MHKLLIIQHISPFLPAVPSFFHFQADFFPFYVFSCCCCQPAWGCLYVSLWGHDLSVPLSQLVPVTIRAQKQQQQLQKMNK